VDLRVTQKDIAVKGRNYRVSKMDPRTACWLYAVVSSNAEADKPVLAALGSLTPDIFGRVQTQALKFVVCLDEREGSVFPTAVLAPNGGWADTVLSDDPAALYEITAEAVMFNLAPFMTVRS
jgi:hypothetical protein